MNTTENDGILLRRYGTVRDEEAFRALVGRHAATVQGAALRQLDGDVHAAADVSQRVFVELARHASRLAGHPALAGWLHATVWRMCREVRRRDHRRRARERFAVDAGAVDSGSLPTGGEGDTDRLECWLDGVLRNLGETDRRAVLLRHAEGLPYAEVGRRLGIRENAARMRVARSLERLRILLRQRGIACSAGAIGRALGAAPAAGVGLGLVERWVAAAVAAGSAVPAPATVLSLAAGAQFKAVLAGLAGLVLGTGLFWQHRALQAERGAVERMRLQLAGQSALLEEARAEAARLGAGLQDTERDRMELVRLRGEAARLRRERDEARIRADNASRAGAADGDRDPVAETESSPFNLAQVHAHVGPGQTLVTGGLYVAPDGRRGLVLVTPKVIRQAEGQVQVDIESRIVLASSELLASGPGDGGPAPAGNAEPPAGVFPGASPDASFSSIHENGSTRMVGLLEPDAATTFRQALEASDGIDMLAAPRVTTGDGRQAEIRIGPNPIGGWITLNLIPTVTADGGVDLTLLGRVGTGIDGPPEPAGRGDLEGVRPK